MKDQRAEAKGESEGKSVTGEGRHTFLSTRREH